MSAITTIKRACKVGVLILVLAAGNLTSTLGQNAWTAADYNKALWMTTRFYGAQRSGDNNWVLAGHLPGGVNAALTGRAFRADYNTTDGVDLSGGWHDCGDHVKFGQTQFYSAYLLLKGYAEFPTGHDDKYSYNYAGYIAANNYTWEGSGHDPNCIPDILDEMKHETDFLIKCTPNSSTFWYQVGDGGAGGDHCQWVTAVKMQTNAPSCGGNTDNGTPGARRPSCKNPNDGVMASFAGATLALMARVYQPYDAAYAALCLTHALNAYNYARTRLTVTAGTCFGGFYGAPAAGNAKAAFVCCCAELYNTTGTVAYRTEAIGWEADVNVNAGWAFDYANVGEIGLYCLAQLGNANATTKFNSRITGHYLAAGSRNGNGVYTAYGTWGRLRYNGNAAFLIALYSKLNSNTSAAVLNAIHDDVDYIMGDNASKRTYIVGFEPAAGGPFVRPLKPHHRGVYLRDDNPPNTDNSLTIPTKNTQLGALVGGQRDGTYNDNRDDYVNSEVCIDYNAGLVGALGFIKSRLNPVTGACQTCRTPDIGSNLSTCSGSIFPLTLTDASTGTIPSGVTYTWKRVEPTPVVNPVGTAGATAKSRVIASSDCPSFPCKIVVVRDSTGGCSRTDTVTISGSIPAPTFTGPLAICSPAFYNITPTNLASFPGGTTWQWAVDYSGGTTYNNITGETNSTLSNVRTAGRYRLTALAGSCNNNGNVVVTSTLPTPVDGCVSGSGTTTISITNPGLNGTNYNWYTTSTGSTLATVVSGTNTNTTSITVNVSSTTTYYVQDMSSVNTNVGPTTALGTGNNWGINAGNQLLFTANSNFTLNSFQIPFGSIYSNDPTATVTVEILDGTGASFTPAKTFTSTPINVTTAMANSMLTFPFTGFNIQSSWGPSLRMRLNAKTINGDPLWSAGPASYPYNSTGSIVSITGEVGGSGSNEYMYFYNWNISTGTPCDRLPVVVRTTGCSAAPVELVNFYGERIEGRNILNWVTASEINNDYFNIERSTDGEHFEVIGTVDGMGTKTGMTIYSFADENASSEKIYYRLTQIDFDGTSSSSAIILIESVRTLLEINVAPNPFTNSTELFVSSPKQDKAKVTLTDLSGHTIYSGSHTTNEYTSIGQQTAPGVYILQVFLEDQVKTVQIVKQ